MARRGVSEGRAQFPLARLCRLHRIRAMKRTSAAFLALALPLWIGGCNRSDVTSTETVPTGPAANAEPMSAPVALPDGIARETAKTGFTDEESAKFEAWCKRHGLDSKDPAMLDLDTDRDGYPNREEYIANTNPRDPLSMPGVLDGVVLKEMKDVRVPVLLREVKDGKARVERLDTPGTETWEQGTAVKGLPYRVTSVKHEVKADKHGVFSDMSRVTLENPETKEEVTLVRDLPARSSETHAVLRLADGSEMKVHTDEVIELPGQKDKKFKVIELRPEQVVIEEMGTRRPLTIPKR